MQTSNYGMLLHVAFQPESEKSELRISLACMCSSQQAFYFLRVHQGGGIISNISAQS